MISTATRDFPKTTVWRPARRNGIAHRCASVSAEPRAPVEASMTGVSTSSTCFSPDGAPLRSMTRTGRPVSCSASSPGFAIVAEAHTITGFEP